MRWYLNDSDYETIDDIVTKGNVGDIITYSPDNQEGIAIYKIKLNDAGNKYAEQIGDMYGLYEEDDENMMEQQEGGKRKRKIRAKKSRRNNKSKKGGKKTKRVVRRRTTRRK